MFFGESVIWLLLKCLPYVFPVSVAILLVYWIWWRRVTGQTNNISRGNGGRAKQAD